MKVKKLRAHLENLELEGKGDYEIVLARDEEGNGFNTIGSLKDNPFGVGTINEGRDKALSIWPDAPVWDYED